MSAYVDRSQPNILGLVDHVITLEAVYLVTKLLTRQDIGSVVQHDPSWLEGNVEPVRRIVTQLASALMALHSNGIAHGNITASSILVRSKDPVHVQLAGYGQETLRCSNVSGLASGDEDVNCIDRAFERDRQAFCELTRRILIPGGLLDSITPSSPSHTCSLALSAQMVTEMLDNVLNDEGAMTGCLGHPCLHAVSEITCKRKWSSEDGVEEDTPLQKRQRVESTSSEQGWAVEPDRGWPKAAGGAGEHAHQHDKEDKTIHVKAAEAQESFWSSCTVQ